MVLAVDNPGLQIKRKPKHCSGSGILYCPPQFPFAVDFLSLNQWRELIKTHKLVLDILNSAADKGKNIKIRYKDFDYLNGYSGPLMTNESRLTREKSKFEDVYEKYSLILSLTYGTIAAKCIYNKIDHLSYHLQTGPYDYETDKIIRSLPGVFADLEVYLAELKSRIDSLP